MTDPIRRRRHVLPRAVVAAALLLLALPRLRPAVAAEPPHSSFLWSVRSEMSEMHLLGSVHALSSDYYPLSAAIERAFADARVLVEEVDMAEFESPAVQAATLASGLLPDGQTVDRLLPAPLVDQVRGRLSGLGVPFAAVARFKPWFLAVTLGALESRRLGFDTALGVDKHLFDRARTSGMKVVGLETSAYQISRLDDLTVEGQRQMLAQTLQELDAEKTNLRKLADAWKAGDATTIAALTTESFADTPEMYRRLVVERNRNWMPQLEAFLRNGPHTLVVVGAAHLVGPDGLVAQLKARGYQLEQR
jgi:uncharacterized protein YbaP (TraB family)